MNGEERHNASVNVDILPIDPCGVIVFSYVR